MNNKIVAVIPKKICNIASIKKISQTQLTVTGDSVVVQKRKSNTASVTNKPVNVLVNIPVNDHY